MMARGSHPLAQAASPESMVPLPPEPAPAASSGNGLTAQPNVTAVPRTKVVSSTQTSAGNPMRTDLRHDLDGVFATRNQRLGDVAQVRAGNMPAPVAPYLSGPSSTGLFGIDFKDPMVLAGVAAVGVVAFMLLKKR